MILGQEDLFKDFIEKNIELRTNAKSPFEKDLFKLMSNSIYIYIYIYIWADLPAHFSNKPTQICDIYPV